MNDGIGFFGVLVILTIIVIVVAGVWRLYEKAGYPGWSAIVPIYDIYVLLQIVGRPGWWVVLFFVPIINFFVILIVYLDLAKSFGKSPLYGLGMVFLSIIFLPLLGFSDAQYRGPSA